MFAVLSSSLMDRVVHRSHGYKLEDRQERTGILCGLRCSNPVSVAWLGYGGMR